MSDVRVDIERITLHGFSAADRERFVTALHASLAELGPPAAHAGRAGRAGPPHGRRLGRLTATTGPAPEDAARTVAAQVAAALPGAKRSGNR